MKKCCHCNIEKCFELFGKHRQRKDGLNPYCKECFNKKNREWRKKNPTKWEAQKNKNFENWRKSIGVTIDEKPRKRKPGEGSITKWGYLTYNKKGHPCADKNGRVQASHLVIYENTGVVIQKGQTVHHKDGNTLNNNFSNLEIWTSRHPVGQRVVDKIKWCIDFLSEHGYKVEKA